MNIELTSHELREVLTKTFHLSEGEVDEWMKRFAKFYIDKLDRQLNKFGKHWRYEKEPPCEAVQLEAEIRNIEEEFCL